MIVGMTTTGIVIILSKKVMFVVYKPFSPSKVKTCCSLYLDGVQRGQKIRRADIVLIRRVFFSSAKK